MSTSIYDCELYTDIWKKEALEESIKEQAESVRIQIKSGNDPIEINICGIKVCLDYDNKELFLIV